MPFAGEQRLPFILHEPCHRMDVQVRSGSRPPQISSGPHALADLAENATLR